MTPSVSLPERVAIGNPQSAVDSQIDGQDTLEALECPDVHLIADTYRLISRIGAGAMGIVYEAEHVRLGRRVAVKFLRADQEPTSSSVRRFLREARIIAGVESAYVVSILDCGQLPGGTPYLVTELLRGQSLRSRLKSAGTLEIGETVQIAHDACMGLSAVHSTDVVHRDLKPENLFLSRREGDRLTCKLLDFGVAKLASSSSTAHGGIVGTVAYMAPEQILDSSHVGPQADLYSLGAILFECLTGRVPYDGTSAHAIMFKAMHSPTPDPRALRPALPLPLAEVVKTALRPDPRDRYASALALLEALVPFLDPGRGNAGLHAIRRNAEQSGSKDRSVTASELRGGSKFRTAVIRALVGASAAGGVAFGFHHALKEPEPRPTMPSGARSTAQVTVSDVQRPPPGQPAGSSANVVTSPVVAGDGDSPPPPRALLCGQSAEPPVSDRRDPSDHRAERPAPFRDRATRGSAGDRLPGRPPRSVSPSGPSVLSIDIESPYDGHEVNLP